MCSHERSHTGCRPLALSQRENEPGGGARLGMGLGWGQVGPSGTHVCVCVYECSSHPDWRMSDWVRLSGT